MKYISVFILLTAIFMPTIIYSAEMADMVLVIKSESKLYLIKNQKNIKEYHVVFGANPKGHKLKEGDERTPEGEYILDYKKSGSSFYKAIHISYPNKQDKQKAKSAGVNPGCCIMIHGQKNGLGWFSWISQRFNWTNGCIAVTNSDMDEIWQSVNIGIPIKIKP